MESESNVLLDNWSIITNMEGGGDYLAIQGSAWNHPRLRNGKPTIPGTFVSFDRETMIGVSRSGTRWFLDPICFHPNGNAPTLEAALDFIEKNWVIHD